MNTIVYTQNGCSFCDRHKLWMEQNGVPFEERNISDRREYLKEFLKIKPKGVPCTVIEGENGILQYVGHNLKTKRLILEHKESNLSS